VPDTTLVQPVASPVRRLDADHRTEPPRTPEPTTVDGLPAYIMPIAAASIAFAFCCLIGGIVNLILELAYVRPKVAEYKAARQPVPAQLKTTQVLNWIGIGCAAFSGIWLVLYGIVQAASS
jgi:hypothetical protein